MKRLLLWIVMVAVLVVLLLGGAAGAFYYLTGKDKLPQEAPLLGETELAPCGYEWTVPVLGDKIQRTFTEPTNLTVQKLGDVGEALPALTLPEWASRNEAVLTSPDGLEVVNGNADDFAGYTYQQNGEYELTLTLWRDYDQNAPGQPVGWYTYRVSYTVNIQPKITLSSDRAAQGGVVAVWVTGILDGGAPSLDTDLGTVWFRATQQGYMGYIPVTYNAESGSHTMTLTCGSLVQELSLTVTQSSPRSVNLPQEEDIPGASEEYKNTIWPLYTQGGSEKLWQGSFAAPTTAPLIRDYGVRLLYEGGGGGRNTGLVYAAAAGDPVTATQNGKVLYAGTLLMTGGTVVIDHGCGVKSYLFGLDTVSVQTGQDVALGDNVGTASDQHELIFELRIGSKSVDPAAAINGTSGLQFRENG